MSENNNNNVGIEANLDEKYSSKVVISSDYYEAHLTLDMHSKTYKISQEEIIEILKDRNVVFGIDYDAISQIVDDPNNCFGVRVAKGIKHITGKDGELEYFVKQEEDVKPALLENGRVDFKHLNFVQRINKGDVLAQRTVPTEGKNGTTVTGKIIKARPGKIANFKYGKNVEMSEDELQLISMVEGTVQFLDDKIEVIQVLNIDGDVGVKTGNIEFSGKVVVNGNITSGYSVECEGDLEINGIVEAAKLKTKGNLFISVGIQGNDLAEIECEGDMICGFMNNCKVEVSGNIESSSIMHSELVCDGVLKALGKKGLIVGGSLQIRREIEAKVIGSEMGTITYLKLGIDSKIMDEYNYLATELKEHKVGVKKLDQALAILKKQTEADPTNAGIKAMYDKTRISRGEYQKEYAEMMFRFKEVNETISQLQGSKVSAQEVYLGTKVKIGNSFYNVKAKLDRVIMRKEAGEIIVTSM